MASNAFLYRMVATELRDRIKRGIYRPGQSVPTEADLVQEFRVSGITVRRAIRDLVLEGLLRGRRGAGVFVCERRRVVRSLGGDFRASLGEEIRRAGEEPGIRELACELVEVPEQVARRLQLRPGARVYRHEKLVLAGGEAVGIDVAYLPRRLGDRVKAGLAREFVFPLLLTAGIAFPSIDFTVEGDTLSEPESRLLGLTVGSPALVVNYTPLDPHGRALLTGRSVSRADRFTYAFRLVR
ncbi:MAG: GntR family transcriptional regulator [Candidatus Rokubacteria bacterium]|nr:GntR family transcriptional regulator [Candidatus Rokubacteria bacterium]